jgi:hypothetical protein
MKALLRTAAVLSFGFCFAGGLWLVGKAASEKNEDLFLVVAVGLVLIGMAFFVGAILLVAAERFGRKYEGR